jgi:hypothetical protein
VAAISTTLEARGRHLHGVRRLVRPPGWRLQRPGRRSPLHAAHHVEHPLSLGMLGMSLQGHGKLRQRKAETLKAKGCRELGGERALRVGEKQGMAATQGMNPFLKKDSPTDAPRRR